MPNVQKLVLLQGAIDRLARQERDLRNIGDVFQADVRRAAIVTLLRMADEEVPPEDPIEPSES